MIAIVTVLFAFPLGYFLASRLTAYVAYGFAYLWAFVFQTLYLLLDSMAQRDGAAFTADDFPLSYGVVTLGIFAAGFGIVWVGGWLRRRRAVSPLAEAR